MATTRIIPMHLNKGKTLAQCLADRTEYGMNPDKTEGGALISAFVCEPETAVSEFALSKREYRELTGRVQESDVIAYQVRQSFKPGEVTPEEANRIGYEFAKRFLKGRHAFLVCTHTDKKHIHNHIYWNSTALDCTRKFKNFIGSYRAVRRLSDLICAEHRLSVVENPQKHGLSYNKRYRIAQAHPGIEFRTHEKQFNNRYEALSWICKNQLGRRNLTPQQKKYLIGERYDAEKKAHGGDRKSGQVKSTVQNEA